MKEFLEGIKLRVYLFFKWVLFAILTGCIAGGVAILFSYAMQFATQTRKQMPMIVIGLPFAGLVIVFLYQTFHKKEDKGTNMIIAAIREEEEVPFYMAPLIFITTVITHLFGGSSGREGAALQIGGSISYTLGRILHIDMQDKNAIIMCGMSAAFSALFGTPLAATIFALEVVSVGVMYYSALVPCAFSAIIGAWLAKLSGVEKEGFIVHQIPEYTWIVFIKVVIVGFLCALVSMLFCVCMHKIGHLYKEKFKNPYLRIFIAGILILLLTKLVGTMDYMGAGMDVIARAIDGQARPWDFLLKILLTSLTLGAGYRGGEIVPSFFVGATFGCVAGQVLQLSPSLCAAMGMVSVFCGVTNCPITSLFIAAELFGFEGAYYYLPAIAVSYMLSGYLSLYSSQKIMYSKFYAKYINKKTT